MLPEALCVVKKAAWSNPFMAGIMWATGYIPNDDPNVLIAECVKTLQDGRRLVVFPRSEEHTSALQSLMRISYAVFCLKKKKTNHRHESQQAIIIYLNTLTYN